MVVGRITWKINHLALFKQLPIVGVANFQFSIAGRLLIDNNITSFDLAYNLIQARLNYL
jgi:hypothetical protein